MADKDKHFQKVKITQIPKSQLERVEVAERFETRIVGMDQKVKNELRAEKWIWIIRTSSEHPHNKRSNTNGF